MPENKSIYDVAFGAGAETGKYGAELLKTEDIWERIAHREKVTDWKIEEGVAMADTAMATLGLVSEVYGGYKAKQEFEGALISTQERAAESAYIKTEQKRSIAAKDTAVKWSELDPSKQKEWIGKFKPEKKEQEWYETLFGKESEYKFGESDYFTKTSITASKALSEATSLEEMVDVEDWASTSMAEEADLSKGSVISEEVPVEKTPVEVPVIVDEPAGILGQETDEEPKDLTRHDILANYGKKLIGRKDPALADPFL